MALCAPINGVIPCANALALILLRVDLRNGCVMFAFVRLFALFLAAVRCCLVFNSVSMCLALLLVCCEFCVTGVVEEISCCVVEGISCSRPLLVEGPVVAPPELGVFPMVWSADPVVAPPCNGGGVTCSFFACAAFRFRFAAICIFSPANDLKPFNALWLVHSSSGQQYGFSSSSPFNLAM